MAVQEHKREARANLKVGVVTASDSRTPETDESGKLVRQMFEAAGHQVSYYEIVRDEAEKISGAIVGNLANLDAIVITGGTGVTSRDCTPDVVKPLLDKELEGFGELFRSLSYQEIGSAAMMSRAIAGIRHGRFVAAIPGSTAACRLAMEKLILPELGHIVSLLRK